MESLVVLFDMDGLMLDTERMAVAAWNRALADRGYTLDPVSFQRILGLTVQDTARVMEEVFGPGWSFQEAFAQRQAYYLNDIEVNGIPIKPGLLDLLGFLEEKGISKAIASSTPCWFAAHKLGRSGLEQRFQTVVCGDMVARGKPAPDLFLEAARQMAIPPERCVVLEDSEVGILAAHEAGMVPVMVPDLKQPAAEIRALAYRVLPTLNEVIPLIEGFLVDGLP